MNAKDLHRAAIARKGEIHRLHNGLGQRIESLRGALWVTIDHDTRDIVVSPGASFAFDLAATPGSAPWRPRSFCRARAGRGRADSTGSGPSAQAALAG